MTKTHKYKQEQWDFYVGIAALGLVAFLSLGWCLNVYRLVTCDWKPPYKEEAIRSIAVFVAPAGGVIGWHKELD